MNKKTFLAIAIMIALIVPASFAFSDKDDDKGYVEQVNVTNFSPEVLFMGLGSDSPEEEDEQFSLKDLAEFLFLTAQSMLEPRNLSDLGEDYEVWEGTKTIDGPTQISKHLVLADGLKITFEEGGKIQLPIGCDLIINGTVEFKNEGNGIHIEFVNDEDEDTDYSSAVYIGQIPVIQVYDDEPSNPKIICDGSFTVGFKANNNFGDETDPLFYLDYEVYLDILGSDADASLKIIIERIYSESTYDNDLTEFTNNPEGKELHLKAVADLSNIYNIALMFESKTLEEVLDEFTGFVESGDLFLPNIDIKLDVYDLFVKENWFLDGYWDDGYYSGTEYTSIKKLGLSLVSDSESKKIEGSLNINRYEESREEENLWLGWSDGDGNYGYMYSREYDSKQFVDDLSLSVSIDSKNVIINLTAEEISTKTREHQYEFVRYYDYYYDYSSRFYVDVHDDETLISDISLEIKIETVGLMKLISNLGGAMQKDFDAISELLDDVLGFDLSIKLTIGNVVIGSTEAIECPTSDYNSISPERFEELVDSIKWTETTVDISDIVLDIIYKDKKASLFLSADSIESDTFVLSDLSIDVKFDIADFDGDAIVELYRIFDDETYLDSIDAEDIFALYDSMASMSQSANFHIGYLSADIDDYAVIEIKELYLEEAIPSDGLIQLEMKFEKFYYAELSEDESEDESDVYVHISDAFLSIELEANGIRDAYPDLLSFVMNFEEADPETLIEKMNLRLALSAEISIEWFAFFDKYEGIYLELEEFVFEMSVATSGNSNLNITLRSLVSDEFELYGLDVKLESEYGDLLKYVANFFSQIPEDGPDFGFGDIESLIDDYLSIMGETNVTFSIGFDRMCFENETTYLLIGLDEGYDSPEPGKKKAILLSLELAVFEVDDDIGIGVGFALSLTMSDDAVVIYDGTRTYAFLDGFYLNLNANTGGESENTASFEIGFNKFYREEVSEDDLDETVSFTISNVMMSIEAEASGVRAALSGLLPLMSAEKPDFEAFLDELDVFLDAKFEFSVESVKYSHPEMEVNIEDFALIISVSSREKSTLLLTLKSAESPVFEIYGLQVELKSEYGDAVKLFANAMLLWDFNEYDIDDTEDVLGVLMSVAEESSFTLSVEFNRLYFGGETTLLIGLSEGYRTAQPDGEKAVRISLEFGIYKDEDNEQMFNVEGEFLLKMSDNATILYKNPSMSLSLNGLEVSLIMSTPDSVDIRGVVDSEDFGGYLDGILKKIIVKIELSFDEFELESEIEGESIQFTMSDLKIKLENNLYDVFSSDNVLDALGDYEITIGTLIILEDMDGEYIHISFYNLVSGYDASFEEEYLLANAKGGVTADIFVDDKAYSTKISGDNLRLDGIFSIDIDGNGLTVAFREFGSSDKISPGFLMIQVDYATISEDSDILAGETYVIGSEILVFDGGTVSNLLGWRVNDVTYLMGEYVKLMSPETVIREVNEGIFTVTYEDGDSDPYIRGYTVGDTIFEYIPEKTGYTFAGWNPSVPEKMPSENLTFTASWTVNRYTLTFDSKGGTSVATITLDYDATVTAPPEPTNTGYKFIGWNPDLPSKMPSENLTFTAVWEINKYRLTFDSNGGSEVPFIQKDYGSAVRAPSDPTKDGHVFDGWSSAVPLVIPAENLTFTAKWIKLVVIDDDYTESSVNSSEEDSVAITGNDLEKLKSNAESKDSEYIDIKLKGGSVYLPKDAVDQIVKPNKKDSDIRLSLETSTGITDEAILGSLSEEMRTKIANATVVSINLTNAKTTKNLGDVKIVIPYTLKEGERSDLVKVYYIGSDGSVEEKNARYFEEGGAGYVEFTTTHFSHYAIIFDNIVPSTQSDSQSNYLYYIIAAVAILAIGALAIVVTRKSRA